MAIDTGLNRKTRTGSGVWSSGCASCGPDPWIAQQLMSNSPMIVTTSLWYTGLKNELD